MKKFKDTEMNLYEIFEPEDELLVKKIKERYGINTYSNIVDKVYDEIDNEDLILGFYEH